MNKRSKYSAIISVVLVSMLACNLPQSEINYEKPDILATMMVATSMVLIEQSTSAANGEMLPYPLYFLSEDDNGIFQLWRLAIDGFTVTQISDEPTGISDYAISPNDGLVAFVANNQLVLINADGSDRIVLLDGGPPDESDHFNYHKKISGLAWSPDGRILAYGQDGVVLHDIQNNISLRVVQNEVEKMDDGSWLPRNLYFPHSWSPDGQRLLLDIGWMEAGTLGVWDVKNSSVVQMGSGVVCCQTMWLPDSSAILVSSPVIGLIDSGLWRYQADSGEQSVLIPTTSDDNTLNFVGWPFQLQNGDLFYFFNNMADFPEADPPLTLVHSGADGASGRMQIRPESWDLYEALWAPDGSKVVAVQPPMGEQDIYPRRGPIVLIDVSGSLVQPLAPSGYNLQWGR